MSKNQDMRRNLQSCDVAQCDELNPGGVVPNQDMEVWCTDFNAYYACLPECGIDPSFDDEVYMCEDIDQGYLKINTNCDVDDDEPNEFSKNECADGGPTGKKLIQSYYVDQDSCNSGADYYQKLITAMPWTYSNSMCELGCIVGEDGYTMTPACFVNTDDIGDVILDFLQMEFELDLECDDEFSAEVCVDGQHNFNDYLFGDSDCTGTIASMGVHTDVCVGETLDCHSHNDCTDPALPFCSELNVCEPCNVCQYCSDGVDNTCGSCTPVNEATCDNPEESSDGPGAESFAVSCNSKYSIYDFEACVGQDTLEVGSHPELTFETYKYLADTCFAMSEDTEYYYADCSNAGTATIRTFTDSACTTEMTTGGPYMDVVTTGTCNNLEDFGGPAGPIVVTAVCADNYIEFYSCEVMIDGTVTQDYTILSDDNGVLTSTAGTVTTQEVRAWSPTETTGTDEGSSASSFFAVLALFTGFCITF